MAGADIERVGGWWVLFGLAALPGLDAPTAHRLVELRDEVGGFSSTEEAGALLELPPVTVERLDRRAVSLPF